MQRADQGLQVPLVAQEAQDQMELLEGQVPLVSLADLVLLVSEV